MKAFVVEEYGAAGLHVAQIPDPAIGPGDVLVRVSAASINPLDKMVRNGEVRRLLKYKTPLRARARHGGRRDARGGRRAGLRGRRYGLRPTPRPANRNLRRVHRRRPCGHRTHSELAHDGTGCSGPAGGACRVAGAGRPRASQAGAEGPRSRGCRRSGHDSHPGRQASGRIRCHDRARQRRGEVARPRRRRGRRLHEGRLCRVALRLRRRPRLPWRRQPCEVAHGAQARGPCDQRGRPAGRRVRQADRPARLDACDGTHEPKGPGAGQEARRALLVLLHASRWRATEGAGPLHDAGALRPVIDRTFAFDETLDAMAFVEQGHAKGKIVVVMPPPGT